MKVNGMLCLPPASVPAAPLMAGSVSEPVPTAIPLPAEFPGEPMFPVETWAKMKIIRDPKSHRVLGIEYCPDARDMAASAAKAIGWRLSGRTLAERMVAMNRPPVFESDIIKTLTDFSRKAMESIWEQIGKYRMVYPSAMAAHVVYISDETDPLKAQLDIRLPYTEAMKKAKVLYKQAEHFKAHESSQLLDARFYKFRMPDGSPATYVWVSAESVSNDARQTAGRWATDIVRNGWQNEKTGIWYDFVYGSFIDRGRMLLAQRGSGIESLASLGLILSSNPKGAKRFRRDTAAHQVMLEFDVIDAKKVEKGVEYTLQNKALGIQFDVLDFDMSLLDAEKKGVVDGMHVCNLFGKGVKLTSIIKRTAKGYGRPNPRVKYGLVFYGSHSELLVKGKKAYIGSLGDLHAGEGRMDPQTYVNMGFYEPQLVPAEGIFQLGQFGKVMLEGSEAERRDVLARFDRIARAKAEQNEGTYRDEDTGLVELKDPTELWATVRAFELGIGVKAFPVLFRRFVQSYFGHTMDVPEGRVPMRQFTRLNVGPNPLMWLSDGDLDLSLDELGPNEVCCWDLPEGSVLLGRNPNTHHNEAIVVFNRQLASLKFTEGSGDVFFGRSAGKLLKKLNGGDQDDTVWATADPAYIEKWKSYEYQVAERKTKLAKRTNRLVDGNEWLDRQKKTLRPDGGYWTRKIVLDEIKRWMESGMTLGTYVNNILADIMLSGEFRQYAIKLLKQGKGWSTPDFCTVGNAEAFAKDYVLPFLLGRPDHQLVECASFSEDVIDWLQMMKGEKSWADYLLNKSRSVHVFGPDKTPIPCYPKSFYDQGRVPPKRLKAGDFLLVETPACAGLEQLLVARNRIIETCRETEWMLAKPIPDEVDAMFPADADIREMASQVNTWWLEAWATLKKECRDNGISMPKDAYKRLALGWTERIVLTKDDAEWDASRPTERQVKEIQHPGLDSVYLSWEGHPIDEDTRLCVAVEIFRRRYSRNTQPKYEEDSEFTQSFADGLPDYILHDFLTALEQAGLTGKVVVVELNPKAKRRLTEPVQVNAVDRKVYGFTDGTEFGSCDRLEDGTYTMSVEGVIVVREAAEELQSEFVADDAAYQSRLNVACDEEAVDEFEELPY